MESTRISVIVPVFNAEPYLPACLDSVLGQTHRALEIILINDGSTDGSGAVCDEYAARDSRVTVIHQENTGPSAARNRGLDIAAGDWVTFVDSDDYLDADLCAYLLSAAEENGADLVQCGSVAEDPRGGSRVVCPRSNIVLRNGADGFEPEHWRDLANSNWGKLYRRAVLGDIRFDPLCRVGEDLQFNLRFLMRADGVVLGCEARYHYVLTAGSLFRGAPTRETLLNCREMLGRMEKEAAVNAAVSGRIADERYRNGLDICSKIVCFRMKQEIELRKEIQREIRSRLPALLMTRAFSVSEKAKFVLIAYVWLLYCGLLLLSKQR